MNRKIGIRDENGRFIKGHPGDINYGHGYFEKGHPGYLNHPNQTSFKKGQKKSANWYEVMKKHIIWNKGKKGIHLSPKTEFKKGIIPWSKGRFGELSPGWKGGKTKIVEMIRKSEEYKKWRMSIFLKDNFTCQFCRKRGGSGRFEVHHIKELNKIIDEYKIKNMSDALNCKELWNTENAILLCFDCHQITKNGRKKKAWHNW